MPGAPARDLAGQLLGSCALLVERFLDLLAALIDGTGHGLQQRIPQFVVLVHHELSR